MLLKDHFLQKLFLARKVDPGEHELHLPITILSPFFIYVSLKPIIFILNKLQSWVLKLMANLVVKDSALLNKNTGQQPKFSKVSLLLDSTSFALLRETSSVTDSLCKSWLSWMPNREE